MATIATRMKEGYDSSTVDSKKSFMLIRYKHRSYLYKDITAVVLFLAIIVVTANWFENSGFLFFEGLIGLLALLFRFLEFGKKSEKEVLEITRHGIMNQWGYFRWDRIRDMRIEDKHYLMFTGISKIDQTEKAFRYDIRELDIDRKHLEDLAASHQNKTPQL